jgi:hypothetical protein
MWLDVLKALGLQSFLHLSWARWKVDHNVVWVKDTHRTRKILRAKELQVILDQEFLCFSVKVLDWGHQMATSDDPQCLVLHHL